MKLQRLLQMGPTEIACRASQELAKTAGRLAAAVGAAAAPAPVFPQLRAEGEAGLVRDHFRAGRQEEAAQLLRRQVDETLSARFFAGAGDEGVTKLLVADAGYREQVEAAAAAVARGEFGILGHGRLYFGEPVDWHADPVAGKRAGRGHWSRLDPLDPSQVGDSKVVWELNRHQWLLELGQAWRLSGDDAHAHQAVKLLRSWMRENPPGRGINWSSSLEVALRLIAWCWALVLFRGARPLSPAFHADMLAWLRVHACHVERYLSHYFAPNTHLTGEALGLFYAGSLFPALRGAERWRRLGAEILDAQIERQVHEDGVYFEQSLCYQYYTVEIYLHYLLLSRRAGRPVSAHVEERLRGMMDFLLTMRRPDGLLPQIGDVDGGWLLPLLRRPAGDFSGLFSTAAVLFQRADLAWAAGKLAPETLWLLGTEAAGAFAALRPAPPEGNQLRLFRQGGYAVLRSGWEADAHQLIFDIGPLGQYGHGHADLLSIQCAAHGEAYLVDPGTGCYTADGQWREHFRHSAAHNTLTVDGRSQAEARGPFNWRRQVAAQLLHWERGPEHELVVAGHRAWPGIHHRRRVFFVRPRYWLLIDDLEGEGEHELHLHFQFAPLPVAAEETGWLRARGAQGGGLLLRTVAAVPVNASLHHGETKPTAGWVSANYGQREPAPALLCQCQGVFPLRLVSVLLPLADATEAAPGLDADVKDGRVVAITLHWPERNERIEIGADTVALAKQRAAVAAQA